MPIQQAKRLDLAYLWAVEDAFRYSCGSARVRS